MNTDEDDYMQLYGWKYYNHAAIPSIAPHQKVNLEPIINGSIWKLVGGTPFLARWSSDWDCGYKTDWWYIICDSPFRLEDLSKSSRKNIRKSLGNCEVRRINPTEYADDLWRVFQEATARYDNYQINTNREGFINQIKGRKYNQDYWAGFDKTTNRMIGYKICNVYEDWVEFSVSKYSVEFLKLRVSDALNAVCLDFYLNDKGKRYITNGTRSLVHETNVQDYYQEHFHFRKAYCKLHIKYRFPLNIVVKMIYPFRMIIPNCGNAHLMVSLLKMEEIRRSF